MLIVHSIPESLYCAKLRILLRHKNLDWRELPSGHGGDAEAFDRKFPASTLPAIEDGDFLLADSEAIAEYLDEKFPDPPMLPPRDIAARAKVRERSRFHDTRLEPALRLLFPHVAPGNRDPVPVTQTAGMINRRLAQLGRILGGCGREESAGLTLGDCGFPVTFLWIDVLAPVLDVSIDWPQTVRAYQDELSNHPAVEAELRSYRPAVASWLSRKLSG